MAYVCNDAFDKHDFPTGIYIAALRKTNWRVSGFGIKRRKANDFNEVIVKIREKDSPVIVVHYCLEPDYWRYSNRGFGKKDAFLDCRLVMVMINELRNRGSESVIVVPTEISLPSFYAKDYIEKGADAVLKIKDFSPFDFVDEITRLARIKERNNLF
ncbi:MAG: hypothetical protein AABX07_05725 [Nanoarchaeota archaeon]